MSKKEQLYAELSGVSLKDAAKRVGINYSYAVGVVKQWKKSGVVVSRRCGQECILRRVEDDEKVSVV